MSFTEYIEEANDIIKISDETPEPLPIILDDDTITLDCTLAEGDSIEELFPDCPAWHIPVPETPEVTFPSGQTPQEAPLDLSLAPEEGELMEDSADAPDLLNNALIDDTDTSYSLEANDALVALQTSTLAELPDPQDLELGPDPVQAAEGIPLLHVSQGEPTLVAEVGPWLWQPNRCHVSTAEEILDPHHVHTYFGGYTWCTEMEGFNQGSYNVMVALVMEGLMRWR